MAASIIKRLIVDPFTKQGRNRLGDNPHFVIKNANLINDDNEAASIVQQFIEARDILNKKSPSSSYEKASKDLKEAIGAPDQRVFFFNPAQKTNPGDLVVDTGFLSTVLDQIAGETSNEGEIYAGTVNNILYDALNLIASDRHSTFLRSGNTLRTPPTRPPKPPPRKSASAERTATASASATTPASPSGSPYLGGLLDVQENSESPLQAAFQRSSELFKTLEDSQKKLQFNLSSLSDVGNTDSDGVTHLSREPREETGHIISSYSNTGADVGTKPKVSFSSAANNSSSTAMLNKEQEAPKSVKPSTVSANTMKTSGTSSKNPEADSSNNTAKLEAHIASQSCELRRLQELLRESEQKAQKTTTTSSAPAAAIPAIYMIKEISTFAGEPTEDADAWAAQAESVLNDISASEERKCQLLQSRLQGAALAEAKVRLRNMLVPKSASLVEHIRKYFQNDHSKSERKSAMKKYTRSEGQPLKTYVSKKLDLIDMAGIEDEHKRNYWLLQGLGEAYLEKFGNACDEPTSYLLRSLDKYEDVKRRAAKDCAPPPATQPDWAKTIEKKFEDNNKALLEVISAKLLTAQQPTAAQPAPPTQDCGSSDEEQVQVKQLLQKIEKLEGKINEAGRRGKPRDYSKYCEYHQRTGGHTTSECRRQPGQAAQPHRGNYGDAARGPQQHSRGNWGRPEQGPPPAHPQQGYSPVNFTHQGYAPPIGMHQGYAQYPPAGSQNYGEPSNQGPNNSHQSNQTAPPATPRRSFRCFRCGSDEHLIRGCPRPAQPNEPFYSKNR